MFACVCVCVCEEKAGKLSEGCWCRLRSAWLLGASLYETNAPLSEKLAANVLLCNTIHAPRPHAIKVQCTLIDSSIYLPHNTCSHTGGGSSRRRVGFCKEKKLNTSFLCLRFSFMFPNPVKYTSKTNNKYVLMYLASA